MAKPRIFISSTYFDLKNVRADLERFIKTQGYEPVLNEKGHIPYGTKEKLEEYCYKEVQTSDILISIIGGRFGSQSSRTENHSISNMELKTAIELGKQIYIFIDRSVNNEFKTYERNKNNKDISYASVDDIRIFGFIDEIINLPIGNPIASFETTSEITDYLKEQWAGLFQRLLSENSKQKETAALNEIKATAKTLNQLVNFLVDERKNGDQAIKEILLSSHPAFEKIKEILNVKFRIFFTNIDELNQLLLAHGFELSNRNPAKGTTLSWIKSDKAHDYLLEISLEIFDESAKLKTYTPNNWNKDYITLKIDDYLFDEDIPF